MSVYCKQCRKGLANASLNSTLFRLRIFGGCSLMGVRAKEPSLPKFCDTHPIVIKIGEVIPYLKKVIKYINQSRLSLISTDISIVSAEITNNFDDILYVNDITNKMLLGDSSYIVDVVV